MRAYLKIKYAHLLSGDRTPVSVHIRAWHELEPDPSVKHRVHPSDAWYRKVLEDKLDPAKVVYLVFTEVPSAASFFEEFAARNPLMKYEVITENFALSLLLMSMCTHHVLAVSTFSFWGLHALSVAP